MPARQWSGLAVFQKTDKANNRSVKALTFVLDEQDKQTKVRRKPSPQRAVGDRQPDKAQNSKAISKN